MKQGIQELVVPPLTSGEARNVWDYFDSHCAYCGDLLSGENGDGVMDHLIPCAKSGSGSLSNRVLACAECNTDKGDKDWQEFLRQKCSADDALFAQRHERILEHQRLRSIPLPVLSDQAQTAKLALEATVEDFKAKYLRLKALIRP